MPSIFGSVARATKGRVNASKMDRLGSFYARIEKTKYIMSDKGPYGVVECTVIQPHDEEYKVGEFLADMCGENYRGQIANWMAPYVASANNVEVGHSFSDIEEENEAKWKENENKWDELTQEIFGTPEVGEGGKMIYAHENILKGVVGHWKIVEDRQNGRKNPKKDDEGNVIVYKKAIFLGLVSPEDIDPEVLEREKDNLHQDYNV